MRSNLASMWIVLAALAAAAPARAQEAEAPDEPEQEEREEEGLRFESDPLGGAIEWKVTTEPVS